MVLLPVQSLWVGNKLSELEILCIKSFQKNGHKFHLYTYNKIKNLPPKVIVKDANNIILKKNLFTHKSSFLPFSDLFRYKLLYDKGGYWVDMDMICLRPFRFRQKFVFSAERTIQKGPYRNRESKEVPHNGILKAPKNSEFYKELYLYCLDRTKKINKNTSLLVHMKNMIKDYKYEKYVQSANTFCPLDWWHTKDAFYPPCCESKYGTSGYKLEDVIKGPYSVHFWRSIMVKRHKIDIDKDKFDKDSIWMILKKKFD